MKRIYKLFLIYMVIAFLPLCTDAVAELNATPKADPMCGPAGMFLLGVGLIGLAVMVRKRLVK